MNSATSGLESWLMRLGRQRFGYSSPAVQITGHVQRAVEALYVRGRGLQPSLDSNRVPAVQYLDCNPDLSAIAMSFADGMPLDTRIIRSFFSDSIVTECLSAMDRVAMALAALNSATIPDGVHLASPCSNEEYARRIDEYVHDDFVGLCLTAHGSSPSA